ncbi:diguanylate cyclase domain-containing protein [Salipaludibacillus sp. HK11]|uniref:diguanylate cyclase domain-containing protein n=1 Tax=Salipaludibacillus sp. HK11 TaxID=3394320 RepID=UPI0039FD8D48
MSGKLLLEQFSRILDTVFREGNSTYKQYSPSIVFFAERSGEVKVVRQRGSVSPNMVDFSNDLVGKVLNETNPFYHVLTTEVTVEDDLYKWEGLLGVIDDDPKQDSVVLQAYLDGLSQVVRLASQKLQTDKKLNQAKKDKNIHSTITKMLNETDYTEDAEFFSRAFVRVIEEYVNSGEVMVFLKDSLKSSFYCKASSDSLTLNIKDFYKIEEKKVEDIIKTYNSTNSHLIKKEDMDKSILVEKFYLDDFFMIPIFREGECVGIILILATDGTCDVQSIDELISLTLILGPWIGRIINYQDMQIEKVRNNLLLKVNRKFYSTMDVNSILKEILHALHEAYPTFEVNLMLSSDWNVADYLPVEPLEIANPKKDPGSKAYLTGEVQVLDSIVGHNTILFVPLKGKQGVYGIFKMITDSSQIFLQSELDFIEILASTGGNAIENAELYQQSQQYIRDLQLINQTSHQLNANLKLEEAIGFMISQMKEAFLTDDVGFIMLDHHWSKNKNLINWSESSFHEKERKPFVDQLLKRMEEEKEEIFLGNWSLEGREFPFKSVIGIPMVHNEKVIGAVLVLGRDSYAFNFDMFKLCQSFVHHSSLAIVNAILHEEMKELVVTDYLTKLFTREYMDEKVAESMRDDGYGAFILFDIDHFKGINDRYGHQTGDHVLIQVAKVILENTKNHTDIGVRWGGEELAVYLPKTKCKEAVKVAERIRGAVEENTDPNVTVSCGVSEWSHVNGIPSLTKLFSDADKAMYKAKHSGRNNVVSYEEDSVDQLNGAKDTSERV